MGSKFSPGLLAWLFITDLYGLRSILPKRAKESISYKTIFLSLSLAGHSSHSFLAVDLYGRLSIEYHNSFSFLLPFFDPNFLLRRKKGKIILPSSPLQQNVVHVTNCICTCVLQRESESI